MQSLKARSASLQSSRVSAFAKPSRVLCKAAAVAPVETFSLADGRKVEVYSSKEDASKAICTIFKQAYAEEVKAKGSITIAIPSGSVVVALGSLAGSPDIDFSKVHVFFCNERQGGKTFKGDLKDFIEPAGVPLSNCYAIEDWSNPPASAAAYEATLAKSPVLTKKSSGAPSLDLILLGTGDDGHCASINPNTDEVKAKSGWILPIAEKGDKPGGMTVSIFLINAAKRVVVSAAEPKRAEMVKRGLTGVFPEFDCPAGLVSTKDGAKVTWVTDTDSIKAYKAK